MKKFILFDNDGVLVETEYWYYLANKQALASLGVDLPRDRYLANMAEGISPWELAQAAGIHQAAIQSSRELRNRYYQESLRKEDIEIDGVLDTIAELSEHYRMAIITTAKRPDFELIHQDRRILEYMEFCLTVEDYSQAKPHPEPYLAGLSRFGAIPAETVVVEDSARGLKSAVAAGIECIVVDNAFTAGQDFSVATKKIPSFRELPSAIRALAHQDSAVLQGSAES